MYTLNLCAHACIQARMPPQPPQLQQGVNGEQEPLSFGPCTCPVASISLTLLLCAGLCWCCRVRLRSWRQGKLWCCQQTTMRTSPQAAPRSECRAGTRGFFFRVLGFRVLYDASFSVSECQFGPVSSPEFNLCPPQIKCVMLPRGLSPRTK